MNPFVWFDAFAWWLVGEVMGISLQSHIGASLHFFFNDVPKVMFLLLLISFLVGTIQTWLQPENVRRLLGGTRTILGTVLASAIGVVTPFCSCSAVPLFIGFLKGGVPLGVTFSYLIAAPMVNEVAMALLWGLFGFRITAIYIAFGVTLAIFGGLVIGLLKLEKWVEPFIWDMQGGSGSATASAMPMAERLRQGWRSSREIFRSVWPYIVGGIGVGAGIHGYLPADLIAGIASAQNPFAVPLAVMLGVPLYANVAGVLPITEALVGKGLPLGTVLAFTMAVTALSLPEMVILRKVLRPQLLGTFVAVMTAGIIGVGYLFNALML
jgi:uncharacterized membrane protein YraQ (UPF0718 family)